MSPDLKRGSITVFVRYCAVSAHPRPLTSRQRCYRRGRTLLCCWHLSIRRSPKIAFIHRSRSRVDAPKPPRVLPLPCCFERPHKRVRFSFLRSGLYPYRRVQRSTTVVLLVCAVVYRRRKSLNRGGAKILTGCASVAPTFGSLPETFVPSQDKGRRLGSSGASANRGEAIGDLSATGLLRQLTAVSPLGSHILIASITPSAGRRNPGT